MRDDAISPRMVNFSSTCGQLSSALPLVVCDQSATLSDRARSLAEGGWMGRGGHFKARNEIASSLERDGWILASGGRAGHSLQSETWLEFEPPIIWGKPHPVVRERYTLRMMIRGIKQRNGPWYLTEHDVHSSEDGRYAIGRSDWVDWSPNGDLLLAKRGSLFRVRFSSGTLASLAQAEKVIDLTDAQFENRVAPPAALRWPKK